MPRKTDSSNPADWLWLAELDLDGIRRLAAQEAAYPLCRTKLAEVLEKVLKAELIRLGWALEKTHDLEKLANELNARGSELVVAARPLSTALAEVYFTERYPGFDFSDPDWPELRRQVREVNSLLENVRAKVGGTA